MRNTCRRVFVVFLFLLLAAGVVQHTQAKDNWVRLKSANFVLVGNADQKKIRDIAVRLEQYRDVFTRLLPGIKYTSNVPTTILVFKDMQSFSKFRPGNVAGYFQPGVDKNYLALPADFDNAQSPYEVMFHEYTHLLIHNSNFSDVPTWFNEGLAEYYSTFQISDNRKVKIGTIIPSHMYILRQGKSPDEQLVVACNFTPVPREHYRVGVLRFETTRGDRLFVSLLGSAFIHLAWLGLVGPGLWWALALSVVYAIGVFRFV